MSVRGWAIVGLSVSLAVSILLWVAIVYAALWAWHNPVKAAGGALAVMGSLLIFDALDRLERED